MSEIGILLLCVQLMARPRPHKTEISKYEEQRQQEEQQNRKGCVLETNERPRNSAAPGVAS